MTVLLNLHDHSDNTLLEKITVDDLSVMTGNMLKQKTCTIFKKKPEEQVLWFKNKEEDKVKLIDDTKTLEAHGIQSDSVILEGRDLGKAKATESELRRNIADKENFSYYYAHANETPLPESTRYVYGGDPIPLGKTDICPQQLKKITEENTVTGANKGPIYRTVTNYSYADSGSMVKIYITQPEVLEIVSAAGEGCIKVEYKESEVCVFFKDEKSPRAGFKFASGGLYKNIDVEKSEGKKPRVGSSKITITLVKEDEETKWYSLKA